MFLHKMLLGVYATKTKRTNWPMYATILNNLLDFSVEGRLHRPKPSSFIVSFFDDTLQHFLYVRCCVVPTVPDNYSFPCLSLELLADRFKLRRILILYPLREVELPLSAFFVLAPQISQFSKYDSPFFRRRFPSMRG